MFPPATRSSTTGRCIPWRRLFEWLEPAVRLVFPPRCAACDVDLESPADGVALCAACADALCAGSAHACPRCAAPVATEAEARAASCRLCRKTRFAFVGLATLGVHRGRLRGTVLRLKRPGQEPLTRAVAQLLAARVEKAEFAAALNQVVAIPTHWRRRWEHGVAAAERLAEDVADVLGLPLARGALRCRRYMARQSQLPPSKRWRNVRDGFVANPTYNFHGARVLLVDDVLTTGATANAATKALLAAGAGSVCVAVAARGVGDD